MTIHARFLPKYPKRIRVSNGLTINEANGIVDLGFDYENSEFGAELAQAVEITNTNANAAAESSDAAEAAASTATSAAAEAVTVVINTQIAFNTVSEASVATISATKKSARTFGFSTIGRGSADYVRVATQPAHTGKFRSVDRYLPDGTTDETNGGWWEIKEPVLNQYMFGAVGDGVTDDTTALQDMLDYGRYFSALTMPGPQIVAAKGNHKISSTLSIMCGCDLSAMTILVAASSLGRAIRVGGNSGTLSDLLYQKVYIRLPVVINTDKIDPDTMGILGTGWAGFANTVGIEIANVNEAEIHNTHVAGFGTNLFMTAYGQGNVGNEIHLGHLGNGTRNLMLKPSDETGWVNENIFYGGHLYHQSTEGTNVTDVNQILISRFSNTANAVNNNLFIKPNIEGDAPQVHVRIRGSYNRILQGRYESTTPKVYFEAVVAGETLYNHIDGGYNAESIVFTEDALSVGNSLTCARLHKVSGNPAAHMLKSENGDGNTSPHIVGFLAADRLLPISPTSSAWTYNLYAKGLDGKKTGDAYARIKLDFDAGSLLLGDGSAAPTKSIINYGSAIGITATFAPGSDNAYQLGAAGNRWTVVYAQSGTINTSDAREKEWRGGLNDAELRVAKRLSKLTGVYQWRDALDQKGGAARLHVGVTAQDVKAAFEAEGLDGFRYGMLCYDQWGSIDAVIDDEGNEVAPASKAGDRYGVRYDELLAFIAAGFEARLSAMEAV